MKCGEEKPQCSNCKRLEEECDYSIRLSWGGRPLKKKHMLNGEEQTEDDSMSLPGAGQFSIHQQFPQQQTFVPQAGTNGASASRKPPVARSGKKSGGMSSYQTVFSVQEPSGPSPATPTVSSPEGHLQGSNQSSSSPSHRAGSSYYSWTDQEHSQTSSPTVVGSPSSVSTYSHTTHPPAFKQEPLEPENVFTERTHLPPFSPMSPYMPQIPSPTFPKGNLQSPLSSPYSHQSQSLVSPQQHQHTQKALHPPPNDFSTPPKRMRTVAPSSLLQPPLYYPTNYVNGSPSTIYQGGFINPFSPVSIAHTAQEYGLPSIDAPNSNNEMRRVPITSIISPPLQEDRALYLDYPNSNVTFGVANEEPDDNDNDVEDIPRYDLNMNRFSDVYEYRMPAASNYPTTLTIPRGLDPLPPILLDNETNMMYFKHFLGFTARLLVPHDCSENPFKKVLPQSMSSPLFHCNQASGLILIIMCSGRWHRKAHESSPCILRESPGPTLECRRADQLYQ